MYTFELVEETKNIYGYLFKLKEKKKQNKNKQNVRKNKAEKQIIALKSNMSIILY